MILNIKKNKKGFTLIEALVAISIILIGVTAAFTVARFGISSTSAIRNRVSAAYMAQEGIEMVKNIKDSNLQRIISLGLPASQWLDGIITQGNSDGRCDFDEDCGFAINSDLVFDCAGGEVCAAYDGDLFFDCDDPESCKIFRAGDFFQQNYSGSPGDDTGFVRKIHVREIVPDQEVEVTSTVSRPNDASFNDVVLKTVLYNWF